MEETLITMYTTGWCGDCRAAKRALDQAGLPYREVDVEHDEAALARLIALNDGRRSVPTLELGGVAASLSSFTPTKLDAFLRDAGLR
jgi:mycoredoxin